MFRFVVSQLRCTLEDDFLTVMDVEISLNSSNLDKAISDAISERAQDVDEEVCG